MKIKIYYVLTIIALAISTVGNAQDCGCTNCPVAITDNGNFDAEIFIQNSGPNILGAGNCLESVCFTVNHTWIGDLDFTLTAPDGTCYIIMGDADNNASGCGSNCDNLNVCITIGTGDPAGTGTTEYATLGGGGSNCVSGIFTVATGVTNNNGPCNNSTTNLDVFNNGSGTVSGVWTLTIGDNCGADTGSLTDWSLNFCDESGIDCSSDPLCLITNYTANIGACNAATGTYSITGNVQFSDEPSSGSLVAEDCDGNQYVLDPAPFPNSNSVNYTINGLPADGLACDLTVFFTADPACVATINYTAPTCPCAFTNLQTNIGACDPSDNTFEITGSIAFQSPPTTGTLTVSDCNGNQQVFTPPFVSPLNYTLANIDSDGTLNCEVTAQFSADPACNFTSGLFDYPTGCVCEADAGTFTQGTVGSTNSPGPLQYNLCWDDELDITALGDYTPPQEFTSIAAPYDPGMWLLVYDCPPTIAPPTSILGDPCLLGVASDADQAWTIVNDAGDNSTLYFVPVTMYSMVDGTYAVSINGGDWCFDLGPTYAVTFLEEITSTLTQDCQAGTATATLFGGLPSLNGSNFTVVPGSLTPASASFGNTTATDGGTITITGLTNGQAYSYQVEDANNCPITISGTFTGVTSSAFTYPDNEYCRNNPNVLPVITGVTGGTFSASPAGMSINATTGSINFGATTAGVTYTISYTSPGAPCNSVSTFDVTVNPLPVIVVPPVSMCLNGSVDVTASGADTYTWSPGATLSATTGNTVTATPAISTTYTVTGTNTATGCVGTNTVLVTVNPLPTIGGTLNACINNTRQLTGSATANAVNPWISSDPGVATISNTGLVTGISAGTTTITYTNSNGCQNTAVFTVNPLPIIVADDVSTCITNPVAINAAGANTYSWSPGTYLSATSGSTVTFTPGANTTYTVTGTDLNGCVGTDLVSVTISPNAAIVASDDVTICLGENTTISASGGVSYNWTTPALGAGSSHSVSPATTTTYTVVGTDASGCVGTDQVVVTISPQPTVNAVTPQTICAGLSTTAVNFTGTATTFNWTNNNASIGLAASGTGNIPAFATVNASTSPQVATITVTPQSGSCIGTPINFTITVNPIPTVTPLPDLEFCAGTATGNIDFTGNLDPSATYNWTNTNTAIGLAASGSGDIMSVVTTNATGAPISGTITVTPVNLTCQGTPTDFDIIVNPIPVVNAVANQIICANGSTADINFAGNVAGANYSWSNNNASIGLASSGAGNILSFTGLNGGTTAQVATITVTPEANGCPGSPINFTITVNPIPNVNAIVPQTICAGNTTTAVTFGGNVAGTTYAWANSNTAIGLGASGSGNLNSFTGTNATGAPISGTITVTPTANTCVGPTTNFTITINPLPTATISGNTSVCNNAASPVITFTGNNGVAPYTFTYNINGSGQTTVVSVGNTATVSVPTGTVGTFNYNLVSVSDASSTACSQAQVGSVSVIVNPNPSPVVVGANEYCAGETASVSTSVAFNSYLWNPNGAVTQSTQVTDADNPITVTVTNGFGCQGTSAPFVVAQNTVIQYNTQVEICQGQSAIIHGVSQSTPGIYSQTFTLPTGCDSTSNVNLIVHALPVIVTEPDATVCQGTSALVNATGAPTITWNPVVANGTFVTQPVGTVVYTATGTDANGCQNTDTYTLTVNPNPTVNPINDVTICEGLATAVVSPTSPTGPATFAWTNSNTTIGLAANGTGPIGSFTAANPTNSAISGTVTVTPTLNSCVGTPEVYTITVSPTPSVNAISDIVLCAGQSTSVAISGGVTPSTYTWTNSNTSIGLAANGTGSISSFVTQNTTTTPQVATIIVTPTASGCPGPTETLTITVNPIPPATSIADQIICAGDQSTLVDFNEIVAGTTFAWTNNNPGIGLAASGSNDINPFTTVNGGGSPIQGSITVTPTANGCVGPTDVFVITVRPLPTASITGTTALCLNGPSPTVTFTGGNGVAPYTFNYTLNGTPFSVQSSGNNATVSAPTNVAGVFNYTLVSVSDASSTACDQAQSGTATITIHALPVVDAGLDQEVCIGESVILQGQGATSYSWNPAITNNVSFVPTLGNTLFTVTGTDVNGCVNQDQVNVLVNPLPVIGAGPDDAICLGESVTLSGTGPAGTDYVWNNPDVVDGVPFSPATTQSYTVTGTDVNGCVNTDMVIIVVNQLPVVNAGNNLTGCSGDDFILTGSGAGVNGTYSWDNGVINGQSFVAPVGTTTYTVTGTDANGCEDQDDLTIFIQDAPIISFDFAQQGNCAPVTVTFTNTSTPQGTNCIWYMDDGAVFNGCGPIVHTFTTPGTYGVTLQSETVENGCVASEYFADIITVSGNPIAAFTADPMNTTTINTEIEFENLSTGATSYIWDFGDNSGNSTVQNPSHTYTDLEAGFYIVTLIANTPAGCSDTATLAIDIDEELLFYVPNTFTPDADQYNETFQPVFTSGFDPFDFTLLIFNRWGELIFESHNAEIGWNGRYGVDGNECQDGVYTWKIEFKTTSSDARKVHVGHVNLLR